LRDGAVRGARLGGELYALFELLRQPLIALDYDTRLLRCLARLLVGQTGRSPTLSDLPARHVAAVTRVSDYLRAHLADDVSLDDLARVAALGSWQLLRAFRRE
jgi:transcriptional regulator GlxA family with amidase domain